MTIPSRFLPRSEADALFGRKHKTGRRNKYAAQKTVVDGITFDSKKEAGRYVELRTMLHAKAITDLELQPRFPITVNGQPLKVRSEGFPNGRQVTYVADFRYREFGVAGRQIVEDTKGIDTSTARIKRALVELTYGITITMLGGKYRSDKRGKRRGIPQIKTV